jgi:hypothetical protein
LLIASIAKKQRLQEATMKRESAEAAELDRLYAKHLTQLKREHPELTWDVAERVISRRVSREIGMTRIEIARAELNYQDYLARRGKWRKRPAPKYLRKVKS